MDERKEVNHSSIEQILVRIPLHVEIVFPVLLSLPYFIQDVLIGRHVSVSRFQVPNSLVEVLQPNFGLSASIESLRIPRVVFQNRLATGLCVGKILQLQFGGSEVQQDHLAKFKQPAFQELLGEHLVGDCVGVFPNFLLEEVIVAQRLPVFVARFHELNPLKEKIARIFYIC